MAVVTGDVEDVECYEGETVLLSATQTGEVHLFEYETCISNMSIAALKHARACKQVKRIEFPVRLGSP